MEVYQLVGGLGNRLRQMLALRLVHGEVAVHWPDDDHCNGHFLDVFEPLDGLAFQDAPTAWFHYDMNFKDFVEAAGLSYSWQKELEVYRELRPRPEILDRLRQLHEVGISQMAGIHVRRTDHIELANRFGQPTGDAVFEEFVNGQACYLATDCPDVQHRWLQKGNVLSGASLHLTGLRRSPLADAVLDLYALRDCQRFRGSFFSSFSGTVRNLRGEPGGVD